MWADANREELLEVWATELRGFAGSDLRDALAALGTTYAGKDKTQTYADYPPTLFQFAGLCRDAKRRREQTTLAIVDKTHTTMPDAIRRQLAAFKAKHVQ